MVNRKLLLPFLFVLSFTLIILSLYISPPSVAQAKPLAGFTPTPIPSDNSGNGGSGGGKNDSTSPDKPSDYVIVQADRCDLDHCSASVVQASSQLLASVGVADVNTSLFTPLPETSAAPELLMPVELIHDGSNFIVEGELSDMKPTRFNLPYPGQWQVWLTGSPRFMTAQAVDVSRLNLPDLQAQLANGPVALGQVQANVAETQMVKCPLACVKEASPPAPSAPPPYFPETGGRLEKEMKLSTFLVIGVLNISVIGLTLWAAFHYSAKKYHP